MENRTLARVTGGLLAVVLLATIGPADPSLARVLGRLAGQSPAVAARPAGPVTDPPPDPGLPAEIMSRVPAFGPRPRAVPVTLPRGPKAAWFDRIPTDQPVAFITIDDGWTKLPEAVALVRAAGVPVTLFLTMDAIHDNPAYFNAFRDAGVAIEAHTVSHPHLRGKPYAAQQREVCGSADRLGALYGRRPTLFRAPFGEHDATTLRVMHDCGLHAALFWKQTVNEGIVRYQQGSTVQRGDIILMHFRPRFVDDFIAALQAIKAAGLTPALLEDYLPATA